VGSRNSSNCSANSNWSDAMEVIEVFMKGDTFICINVLSHIFRHIPSVEQVEEVAEVSNVWIAFF